MSYNDTRHEPKDTTGFKVSGLSDMVDSEDKKPLPKWVPISLLVVTTVAFAVPIVLLRRQWANTVARSMKDAPPPPRRTASSTGSSSNRSPARRTAIPVTPQPQPRTPSTPQEAIPVTPEDGLNDALYSAKAFGIATLIVTVGAITTVVGVKFAMGVQDTNEFAQRMRHIILTRMPGLSARIHRAPKPDDHPANWESPSSPSSATTRLEMEENTNDDLEWSWPSAEERLRIAFRERGVSGWAEAMMGELEAEGELERRKRGHS